MESTGEALKIHCSDECKKILDSLGGYLYEDRGKIPIKGKGELNTYWLTGEVEEYKIRRYQARTERRASKNSAKQISKFLQAQKELQKSSLKSAKSLMTNHPNRLVPFSNNLIRSTSFDSPKKLRFAADNLLEHHHNNSRYLRYSNDALMEVITDHIQSPKKQRKSNDSMIFAVIDANDTPRSFDEDGFNASSSMPCINQEVTDFICNNSDFLESFQEVPFADCDPIEASDRKTPKIHITSFTPLLSET
jgi:Adenylate and Guanylate cyclase catalytic domain